ncbi:hypothetical protein [Paenibacillus kobensis]|jgi:hypothetical protein|uniref:hypothetical protein n=1 Tax=Paenibacillus kobensis TaxID=59841 RepID=UPI000FDBADB4|nr:hypothetical protein [Paenibacillus kobensis]
MLQTMNGTVRSKCDADKRAGVVRAGGIDVSEAHPGVGGLKAVSDAEADEFSWVGRPGHAVIVFKRLQGMKGATMR